MATRKEVTEKMSEALKWADELLDSVTVKDSEADKIYQAQRVIKAVVEAFEVIK